MDDVNTNYIIFVSFIIIMNETIIYPSNNKLNSINKSYFRIIQILNKLFRKTLLIFIRIYNFQLSNHIFDTELINWGIPVLLINTPNINLKIFSHLL